MYAARLSKPHARAAASLLNPVVRPYSNITVHATEKQPGEAKIEPQKTQKPRYISRYESQDLAPYQRVNSAFRDMHREMNALMNTLLGPSLTDSLVPDIFTPSLSVLPTTVDTALAFDVEEEENRFVLTAEVPGFSKDDITVEVSDDNTLTVTGTKAQKEKQKKPSKRLTSFTRLIQLPEYLDVEDIQATIKDGLLTLYIPKKTQSKPQVRQIPIS